MSVGHCFEVNNVGCSYNGTLACDGGGGAAGTCASPHIITCGQVLQGSNTGGTSNWDSYQGGTYQNLTGPERVHTLVIPALTTMTINLTGLNTDLDLLVATAGDPATVFARPASSGTTPEAVQITNDMANPVTYYIIVDGFLGSMSTYNLSCN